jgi:uncharacterized integral membrane protein
MNSLSTNLQPTRTTNLLWLWWTLAGFLGFIGGMTIKTTIDIVAEVGGFNATLEAISPTFFGTLFGAMLGVSVGFFQWLVLRRKIKNSLPWIGATTLSWILFWTLHNAGVFGFAQSPFGLVMQGLGHGAIIGAMVGFTQYLVLRPKVGRANRWLLVCTLSWSLAGGIMHLLLDVLLVQFNIHGPFDVMITTTLAALFSGFGLKHLLSEEPRTA